MGKVLGVVMLSLSLAIVGCAYERPADVLGPADCGDGVVRGSEPCDDGNAIDGDGCDHDCTLTGCGNGIVTANEACDDGNDIDGDGCDTCAITGCGDGIIKSPEICDDGNPESGDGCDASCTVTGCGNGVQTRGEFCDDRNLVDGDGCDSNCTPTSCGNSVTTSGETCDDGNQRTESCEYGETSCTVCNDSCQSVPGATLLCGDGTPQEPNEACDDGNSTCGSCSSDCQRTLFARAIGSITVIAASGYAADNDTFTLNDGVNPPVTFELSIDPVVSPGNVRIAIVSGQNATTVRTLVRDAINNVENSSFLDLHITATTVGATGAVVSLTHDRFTSLGNVAIIETVTNAGFTVSGMSGGAGGDCAAGQSCRNNADCVSTVCQMNVCQ